MPVPLTTSLGIDFGTSHTVAVLRHGDGRVEQLLFDSSPLLPSSVFAREDEILVGRDAIDSAHFDPPCFEPTPKRRIDDGSVLLGTHEISVVDLFAAVLGKARQECLRVLGGLPDTVVLSHPAVWGPTRLATLTNAAQQAGFPRPMLVPEPVAAATYFIRELDHKVPVGSSVVVHDFGGGTFDASVVRRTETGFDVLSVDGLDDLGGVDVDAAIVAYLQTQIDRPQDWQRLLAPTDGSQRRAWRNFGEDVRQAKERLSRYTTADIYISMLDVDAHLTRDELESLTRPLLVRAIEVVRSVIRAAGLADNEISEVVLVGGASRMPLVATMLHRELGHAPVVVDQLEQVVAHGALLTAEIPAVSPVAGRVAAAMSGSDQPAVVAPGGAVGESDTITMAIPKTAPVMPPAPEPVSPLEEPVSFLDPPAPEPAEPVNPLADRRSSAADDAPWWRRRSLVLRYLVGAQIPLAFAGVQHIPWVIGVAVVAFALVWWERSLWAQRILKALESGYLLSFAIYGMALSSGYPAAGALVSLCGLSGVAAVVLMTPRTHRFVAKIVTLASAGAFAIATVAASMWLMVVCLAVTVGGLFLLLGGGRFVRREVAAAKAEDAVQT